MFSFILKRPVGCSNENQSNRKEVIRRQQYKAEVTFACPKTRLRRFGLLYWLNCTRSQKSLLHHQSHRAFEMIESKSASV